MDYSYIALTIVLVILYAHVSKNVEKYANAGNPVARSIVLICGLMFGALGAVFFIENVAEPSWAFGAGFVLGPMLGVGACVYIIVAIFFPLQQVRGLLRYSFRHKLNDNILD